MLLFYNLGIRIYFVLILIASLFNKKAKLWIRGRRNTEYQNFQKSAWFHFASLGEYEQGIPVLMAFRVAHPGTKTVITFFSPSGFEIRKNTPFADSVYYLPLDTADNARHFIDAINPSIVVFTKYEYWYHFFNELHKRDTPLYVISSIFRPDQVFFKWYGSLHRKMLSFVTRFFVQDEDSKVLLQKAGITNLSVSGDTRFDRVWANAQQPKSLPDIEKFINGHKTFIAGSTWPEDERLVSFLPELYPDWKFIIAPHEIDKDRIDQLLGKFPIMSTELHSRLAIHESVFNKHKSTLNLDSYLAEKQVLIIDNIGMLSSLYQYGDIAYIGGGFGAGIHNTLEAAAFGLPVIFGPKYEKFKEAKDLVVLQIGFSVNNEDELKKAASYLIEDENRYQQISEKVKQYVREHTGATETIMEYLNQVSI